MQFEANHETLSYIQRSPSCSYAHRGVRSSPPHSFPYSHPPCYSHRSHHLPSSKILPTSSRWANFSIYLSSFFHEFLQKSTFLLVLIFFFFFCFLLELVSWAGLDCLSLHDFTLFYDVWINLVFQNVGFFECMFWSVNFYFLFVVFFFCDLSEIWKPRMGVCCLLPEVSFLWWSVGSLWDLIMDLNASSRTRSRNRSSSLKAKGRDIRPLAGPLHPTPALPIPRLVGRGRNIAAGGVGWGVFFYHQI